MIYDSYKDLHVELPLYVSVHVTFALDILKCMNARNVCSRKLMFCLWTDRQTDLCDSSVDFANLKTIC